MVLENVVGLVLGVLALVLEGELAGVERHDCAKDGLRNEEEDDDLVDELLHHALLLPFLAEVEQDLGLLARVDGQPNHPLGVRQQTASQRHLRV